MATTIKGGSFGREKRGTSPSSTSIPKKSLKPSSSTQITSTSSSSSSSLTKEKTSSPTNEKPIPNYLKPTMASNLDFSRLPRKSTLDTSSQKPVINRRRSFDRPPSVSQVHNKPLRNAVPSGPEIKHLRSSSFAHKPGPTSDRMYARTSSTLTETKVEPTLFKTRGLKKSSLSTSSSTDASKKVTNNVDTKKESKSTISESRIDDYSAAYQFGVEDDFVGIDSEVQSLPEMSEMPDSNEELGDPAITDIAVKLVENGKERQDKGKLEVVDQVEEHDHRLQSITIEQKLDEKKKTVETKPEHETSKETVNLTVEVTGKTIVVENKVPNIGQFEKLSEEKKEGLVSEQQAEKCGKEGDAKDEINLSVSGPSEADVVGIASKTQSSQEKSFQSSPNNNKPDAAPATSQKVTGKKEKQEYNDVIEETASKLRGKKNKVLALAGAFETVISLEGPKKK